MRLPWSGHLALALALISSLLMLPATPAHAATTGLEGFTAGNIISDADFYNTAAMNQVQVNDFVNAKGATCIDNTAAGIPCLKNYRQITPAMAASPWCAAVPALTNATAGDIVWTVTTACGINPQVMLVMIQKESGLLTRTGTDLTARAYATATGAGCPDFVTCDATLGNFFNQVYQTSKQFSHYRADNSRLNYKPGTTVSMLYNPEDTCGSATFFLANVATASLYTYTPYTPNKSALDAVNGEGDLCAAYGNRNFYRLMKLWFPWSMNTSAAAAVYPSPASTLRVELTNTYKEWTAIGSAMGSETGPMICAATYCGKPFSNGRIYSTTTWGRAVLNPAYAVYAGLGGGTSQLGLPTADAVCGLAGGGCQQTFASGVIAWASAVGTHAVKGAIFTYWSGQGGLGGQLGYPTGDETCTSSTSCYQYFQGGRVVWDATHGILVDAVPGLFRAVTPARVLDSRIKLGALGPIAGGASFTLQVTGRGGVPSTGVLAVALNLTVTSPTKPGYVTVYPTGVATPNASNLNFVAGQTVPNQVLVRVGPNGTVTIKNSSTGPIELVGDLGGYFVTGSPTEPGAFASLAPSRILDTRTGNGASGPVGANGIVPLQVTGRGGLPGGAVAAVVLNVTVTNTKSNGFVTVYPSGTPTPNASNLNFAPGQTVPNLVVAKVGADGKVLLKVSSSGTSDLVADVAGYFLTGTPTVAGTFVPLTPTRLLDTRTNTGVTGAVGPGATAALPVAGAAGLPASRVGALVMNLTATQSTSFGYVTAYPAGSAEPTASTVNYATAQTIPNLAIVGVGAGGVVNLTNHSSGSVALVGDVAGYFLGT